jgi:hypothetical protein
MSAIPDELRQAIREYTQSGPSDEEWQQAIERMPVGAVVVGRVLTCLRMGYFVALGSKVVGQVEVISIKEPGERIEERTGRRSGPRSGLSSSVIRPGSRCASRRGHRPFPWRHRCRLRSH